MTTLRARDVFLALLCLLVLLPRVGGPHLHLCLDGTGPLVAIHLADADGVDAAGKAHDDGHQDQTFDATGPAIGKAWPPGLDAALLLAIVLLLVAPQLARNPQVLRHAHVPRGTPFLRPPLRGPPA